MQIVIDISKDRYDEIMSMDWNNCRLIFDEEIRAIHDGKALEQEPCGDCISREAVMHILDEVGGDFDSPREAVVPIDYIADMVAELPPVTTQHTGIPLSVELQCVLCKIRSEIGKEYKVESEHPYGQGLKRALEIIDKYMAEGSDKE